MQRDYFPCHPADADRGGRSAIPTKVHNHLLCFVQIQQQVVLPTPLKQSMSPLYSFFCPFSTLPTMAVSSENFFICQDSTVLDFFHSLKVQAHIVEVLKLSTQLAGRHLQHSGTKAIWSCCFPLPKHFQLPPHLAGPDIQTSLAGGHF